jgi:uncharacterized protein (TIGR03083 family)
MRGLAQLTKSVDWVGALSGERSAMLTFCEHLSPDDWSAPSAAAGWTVQDVVAHIASGCHVVFSPAVFRMLCSNDIEETNNAFVEERRTWSSTRVLEEYRRWSRRVAIASRVIRRSPFRSLPLPLAELGYFNATLLLCGAMTFDHHTHLRHDIAPALNQPAPVTDANRMTVVLAWMFAVLGNQLKRADPCWLDRPLGITLNGPGGGSWIADKEGVEPARGQVCDTWITAEAIEFPEWATCRAHWRDRDVSIHGDDTYGASFLDFVNVV